jgi:DNA polymerase III subunit epsilon
LTSPFNAELKRTAKPVIVTERGVDTLVLARRKHPGEHNMLDDLCSRYGVNSLRSKHGALLDAELLAAVYID